MTMTITPRVTVVVTAHEHSPELAACLRTVGEQAAALGGDVLLAFNAPEERVPHETRVALSKLCSRVLFVAAPGKSNALNEAVASCDGEVIAFTDDDAIPQAGWLAALVGPLLSPQRPKSLIGTGGRVWPVCEGSSLPDWYRRTMESKPVSILGPRYDLGEQPFSHSLDAPPVYPPIGANCA